MTIDRNQQIWRIGLIGCGRIMELGHARAWQRAAETARVVAVADPSPTRARLLAEMFQVPPEAQFTDYRRMLAEADLDVVDIAVPNFLHEETIVAAARHRVAVISEKPLSTTLDSAERILEAMEQAGRPLSVWHNYLYEPVWRKTIELCRDGAIGTPWLIRHEVFFNGHWPGTAEYDPDWRTRASQAGGGALLDNGYHYIYLAEAQMGSPIVDVYAQVGTFVRRQEVDDTAVLILTHANGGTSTIQFSWGLTGNPQQVAEIHGEQGFLSYDYTRAQLTLHSETAGVEQLVELDRSTGSGFAAMLRATLQAWQRGEATPIDGRSAQRTLAVVLAAYRASQQRCAIAISR